MSKFIYFGKHRILCLGVRRAFALGFSIEIGTYEIDLGPFWVTLEW